MKNAVGGWIGRLAMWLTGLTAEAVISGAFRAPLLGREYLLELDRNRPVMVVTTHLSDSDIQLAAYKLANTAGVNLVVTNQSTQHRGRDLLSLGTMVFVKTLGRGKFSPMGWKWGEDGRPVPTFNREDFYRIQRDVFGKKKALLIAGHNPTFDGKLPDRPGIGAAVATQLVNGIQVLPVGVIVDGEAPNAYKLRKAIGGRRGRSVKVVIGKPFEVDRKLEDWEVKELLDGGGGDREEYKRRINETAQEIMHNLAQLLPKERRGGWG